MPTTVISLILIGIISGTIAAILVFKDLSSLRVMIIPILAAIFGSFVGGNSLGSTTWRETLLGIGRLFGELARTSGTLLLGGVLILPALVCGLLFGFSGALVMHILFPPRER